MTTDNTRTRLQTYIEQHPGQHFNALVRSLDLAPGQVQYHLKHLHTNEVVVRAEFYGRTHYYPPSYDAWERGVFALARRETARDIIFDLLEYGPAAPDAVADRVGIARSTLEWHLDHLCEQNVAQKRRDSRNRVTLVLVRPTDTIELLERIEPSLPERLVDRFERLLDPLLHGSSSLADQTE